ncbi:MAG: DUF721 domain-containing protein [Bacteroidaceae bacterium]|nr:DUF721 domain-containing protein [Bacteroidaceae bacterium]
MQKRQPTQINDLLHMFLRAEGLETPYNQYRIKAAWPEVMGEGIMKYTGEMYIKGQTLYVEIKSPMLKNDLAMSRKSLVQKLNSHINAQVITDIQFR